MRTTDKTNKQYQLNSDIKTIKDHYGNMKILILLFLVISAPALTILIKSIVIRTNVMSLTLSWFDLIISVVVIATVQLILQGVQSHRIRGLRMRRN